MNMPGPAQLRTLDVATRATLYDSGGGGGFPGMGGGGSNFEALSPDGTQALVNSGANLGLIDTANGMSLSGAIMNATMPDWSADGKSVVFVRDASSACPLGLCGSQPGRLDGHADADGPVSGTSFSGETTLVSGGGNNYYPSLSPDGAWVAFNRAAMNSYDAPDAKVLVVSDRAAARPSTCTAVERRRRQLVAQVRAVRAHVPGQADLLAHVLVAAATTACVCSSRARRRTCRSRRSGWSRSRPSAPPPATAAIRRSGCRSRTSRRATTSRSGPRRSSAPPARQRRSLAVHARRDVQRQLLRSQSHSVAPKEKRPARTSSSRATCERLVRYGGVVPSFDGPQPVAPAAVILVMTVL